MPLFVLACMDDADAQDLRAQTRDQHLAYLSNHLDMIKVAGPLYDADQNIIGSLYVFEAETEEPIRKFTEGDPYSRVGLFQRVDIWPWKVTLNRLFG
jgi:uncharacterized protein YciI